MLFAISAEEVRRPALARWPDSSSPAEVNAGLVQLTNNDGLVKRVVEFGIVASGSYHLHALADKVDRVIEQSKGTVASGLGRVSEVTTQPRKPAIGEHGQKYFQLGAQFTFISQAPTE
ncbi:hypothetical protein [Couchioplanes azureus]|uniref:hypothetical protein n=1 Tax=Couchioplanes caeruleus TaxID=56438 RepID=UPI0016716B60|nr:hypothetical protein [Couchioplanes caeruleus]GGQ71448.1 hypothetical protein GCM10010166_46980 [Couchioplanes caeruleus subsp. azureus]